MVGYVYCLSNDSIPGLLKIGMTTRTPEERARELYTTGVAIPFKVEFSIKVDNPLKTEHQLHALFNEYRVKSREFFQITPEDARSKIYEFLSNNTTILSSKMVNNTNKSEKFDYSHTYVYEIVCKDATVQQKYIGLTTNFTQRKYNHKRNYQQQVSEAYIVMAKNGGFDNWQILLLAEYNCKDANEARMMLQKHPGYIMERSKPQILYCGACNYQCKEKSNFKVHCKTSKHIANSSPTKMELVPTPTPNLENLVVELIKQNLEQKDQMTELIKSNQLIQSQMMEIYNKNKSSHSV